MASVTAKAFKIRTITPTCTVAKKFFQNMLSKERWYPIFDAVDCYIACDPTGLYVGELHGKPIGINAIFKYEDNYRSAGCYIVDEAYRDQGYGLRIMEEALKVSSPIDIFSFYAVPHMAAKYLKYFGCEPHFLTERQVVEVSKALLKLEVAVPLQELDIKCVDEVNMQDLCNYDAATFGYRRDKFVERWLQGSYARVAVDKHQNVVGYAAAKLICNQANAYRAGPVFCASLETAKSLLKGIFQDIAKSSGQTVLLDIPVEVSPSVNELAQFLGGNVILPCNFMSTVNKPLPKSNFSNWYAITAMDIA